MDKKFAKVNEWLSKCFPSGIPEYEITDKTIDLLLKVRDLSEQHEQMYNSVKNDLDKKAGEYNAEAERVGLMLKDVGFAADSLDDECKVLLNLLSKFYNTFGLMNTDIESGKLSMYKLYQELLENDSQLEIVQMLISSLTKLQQATKQRGKLLTKFISNVEAKNCTDLESVNRIKALKDDHITENEECEKQIRVIEATLADRNFRPSITYEELKKKLEELELLKSELRMLNQELEGYHELPADFELTNEKIEQAREELELLDEELKEKLNVSVKLHNP